MYLLFLLLPTKLQQIQGLVEIFNGALHVIIVQGRGGEFAELLGLLDLLGSKGDLFPGGRQ